MFLAKTDYQILCNAVHIRPISYHLLDLGSLFLASGFGSLDSESLSHAIKALSHLSEGTRLVGIISHVSELKERIERQIVVTKEKSGASKVNILV